MRISIVTATLNRARFLGRAIESVLAQGHDDVEHVIVDGMSTDGTVELLAGYSHLRVIREPDANMYEGLNKGLRAATGEVIADLNSDDTYPAGVFARVLEAFGDPAVEAVHGGAEILTEDGVCIARWSAPEEIALTFHNVTVGVPLTNARFFRRSIYERLGYCETRYLAAADREFLFRVALANPRSVLLDQIVYRYCSHPGSLTFGSDAARDAKWRDEYLDLAERWLAWRELPAEARDCCRRWHLRESAQAATRALLAGKFRHCLDYAARGLRQNASWPVMFARHVGGALTGR